MGGVGGEWVVGLAQGEWVVGLAQGEWVVGLAQGGWGGVMSGLSLWQLQVSVYCARRIPTHLMCTQYSIMLHLSISAS